jgi:phosphoribosylformylglycinamidine (FGAM) synthase-like enzyme
MSDAPMKGKSGTNKTMIEKIKSLMKRDPNNIETMIISGLSSEKPEITYSRMKLIDLIKYKKPVLNEARDNCCGIIELNKKTACITSFLSNEEINDNQANTGITALRRGIQNIISSGARPLSNVYSFIYTKSNKDTTIHDINEFSNTTGIPLADNNFYFNDRIKDNPLLNIMTIGIIDRKKITSSLKLKSGDLVILAGHFYSNEQLKGNIYSLLKERFSGNNNPPLMIHYILDKLFIEGVLELFHSGIISGAFSIGKSGIISAAADIISCNKSGVRLDIDKLSSDSADDKIYKTLSGYLPHSLIVTVKKEKEGLLGKILNKWLSDYCIIGEIINENNLKCYTNNKLVADIPGECLSIKESPTIIESIKSESNDFSLPDISIDDINEPEKYREAAIKLLKQPGITVKAFDASCSDLMTASTDININLAAGTGVIKPENYKGFITASINSNSEYVSADNKTGIIIMIAKTIKDIICRGSEPIAMSLFLNICKSGNKNFKEQFELIYDGIVEAIKSFQIPLANFNISCGIKSRSGSNNGTLSILPVIGTIGELKSNKSYTTRAFKEKGHMIYLIGRSINDISSSEYLRVIHNIEKSPAPFIDIEFENRLHKAVKGLIENHLIISAHTVSEGGLFFSLLESAIIKGYGFDITSPAEIRLDAFLFGESQGRVIATVSPALETEFIDFMLQQDFPFSALGHVTKEELRIDDNSYGFIGEYIELYNSVIKKIPSLATE